MIKINLLPPELQKKKGRAPKAAAPARDSGGGFAAVLASLGAPVLMLLCAVVLFGSAGYAFYHVQVKIIGVVKQEAEKEAAAAKKARDEYYTYYSSYREKITNYYRMKAQAEILNDLMPERRLLWSEKLKMLSELVPDDVYITDIVVTESEQMVESEESRKEREDYDRARKNIESFYKPASAAGSGEASEADARPMTDAQKKRMEKEIADTLGPEPMVIQKPEITQALKVTAVSVNERYVDCYDKVLEFIDAMKFYQTTGRGGEPRRFMDFFNPEIAYSTMAERVIDGFTVWRFELELTADPLKVEGV